MNYKGLAAAAALCAMFTIAAAPVVAEQISSQVQTQYQAQKETISEVSAGPEKTLPDLNESAGFNILDMLWTVSLAVAGLLLLRKAQGE